jgi:hypothetical protein
MTDETRMAELIGTQQQVIEDLNGQIKKLNSVNKKIRRNLMWQNSWVGLSIFVMICLFCVITGFPIYKSYTTPRVASHCEIRNTSWDKFGLFQVIPWAEDNKVGKFDTFQEAVNGAKMINCKLTQE